MDYIHPSWNKLIITQILSLVKIYILENLSSKSMLVFISQNSNSLSFILKMSLEFDADETLVIQYPFSSVL